MPRVRSVTAGGLGSPFHEYSQDATTRDISSSNARLVMLSTGFNHLVRLQNLWHFCALEARKLHQQMRSSFVTKGILAFECPPKARWLIPGIGEEEEGVGSPSKLKKGQRSQTMLKFFLFLHYRKNCLNINTFRVHQHTRYLTTVWVFLFPQGEFFIFYWTSLAIWGYGRASLWHKLPP